MTVADLIKELKKFDETEEVYIHVDGTCQDFCTFTVGSCDIEKVGEVTHWEDVDKKQVEIYGNLGEI